jgi:uncharacterized protein YqjF (DUF2071 family)
MSSTFLTAQWKKLAMANYAVDPSLLKKYIPYKTDLDLWNNTCYLSLVGFMFVNTRVKGIKIPFHENFEEVNLRFYVKHQSDETGWKRGVVFIKEIVPRPAITFLANTIYNENYQTMQMDHRWIKEKDVLRVEYLWKKGEWNTFSVLTEGEARDIENVSEEEFITEHYWGYTRVNDSVTREYQVLHPRWKVYDVKEYHINVNFGNVYGKEFSFLKNLQPESVFLAEGSEIEVKHGLKI